MKVVQLSSLNDSRNDSCSHHGTAQWNGMHRLLLLPLPKRRVCDPIFFHFLLLLAPKGVCVCARRGVLYVCNKIYPHLIAQKAEQIRKVNHHQKCSVVYGWSSAMPETVSNLMPHGLTFLFFLFCFWFQPTKQVIAYICELVELILVAGRRRTLVRFSWHGGKIDSRGNKQARILLWCARCMLQSVQSAVAISP